MFGKGFGKARIVGFTVAGDCLIGPTAPQQLRLWRGKSEERNTPGLGFIIANHLYLCAVAYVVLSENPEQVCGTLSVAWGRHRLR